LSEISLGEVMLKLFGVAPRYQLTLQPQLILLQKTLLNIEGLGRQLDPDLDLWSTAKPFLERWMSEQVGWRGLLRRLKEEAPSWAVVLPQLPRIAHKALAHQSTLAPAIVDLALVAQRRNTNRLLALIAVLLALIASGVVYSLLQM
jgi:ubiquinone biosynthesis protein